MEIWYHFTMKIIDKDWTSVFCPIELTCDGERSGEYERCRFEFIEHDLVSIYHHIYIFRYKSPSCPLSVYDLEFFLMEKSKMFF